MRFSDKFQPLKDEVKILKKIERQATKRNIKLEKNWEKDWRVSILFDDSLDEQWVFVTLFYKPTKTFVTGTAVTNDLDEFDLEIGETICCNRIVDSFDFLVLASLL